jgi:DNA-binding CsgD family transcriptional regulator
MTVIAETLPTTETPATAVMPRLTHREMTIVYLMSAGHTTPEIAALLDLRARTVESHKRNVYEKLGVRSQGQAVAKVIRLGMLQPVRPPHTPAPGRPARPRLAGELGRATLAVLMGPVGTGRDEVAQMLMAERIPFVLASKREELTRDHWVWWNRGPMVVLLVDPEAEDWAATSSLRAPTVVVCCRDVPGQLAIADALARRAGGLVTRADVATGLGPTLSAVAQGLLVMSWGYAELLLKWAPTPSPVVPQLTARERDILRSIACGCTIRQTARALGIAVKTVENTQARLFRKLGARNRMDALTIADACGLSDRVVEDLG